MKFFLLFILICPVALAGSLSEGNSKAKELIGKVNQSAPLSTDPKSAVPGFVSSSPGETAYGNGNMSDASTQKALTDPASQLINKSFATRPDIKIDRNNNPIFNSAKKVTDNPNAIVNNLTGKYGDCKAETLTTTSSDIRTCDEYTETNDQTCQVGSNVVVDAKHQYQCDRSRVYNDYTCNRSLTLTCTSIGCDAGAITAGSAGIGPAYYISGDTADVISSYSYPTFSISETVPNPRGWGTYTIQNMCSYFSRTIHFTVNDISKIQKFILNNISFIGFVDIKINGVTIYDAPWQPVGRKISIPNDTSSTYTYNGTSHSCPGNLSYNNSPSLNVLPYIKEGDNTLQIISIFTASYGNYSIIFDTEQLCCAKWSESWTDNCGAYK